MTETTGGFQMRGDAGRQAESHGNFATHRESGHCPHGSLPEASDLIKLSVGECRVVGEGTSQTVWRDRQLNSGETRPRDAVPSRLRYLVVS